MNLQGKDGKKHGTENAITRDIGPERIALCRSHTPAIVRREPDYLASGNFFLCFLLE